MKIETRSAPASKDPTWLVQRAWSVFRLPHLQKLVRSAIAVLELEPMPEVPGLQQSVTSSALDPIAEALRACCDELREASGIPGADAERAQHISVIRRHMREEPLHWSEAFTEALETYRSVAMRALEQVLGQPRAA